MAELKETQTKVNTEGDFMQALRRTLEEIGIERVAIEEVERKIDELEMTSVYLQGRLCEYLECIDGMDEEDFENVDINDFIAAKMARIDEVKGEIKGLRQTLKELQGNLYRHLDALGEIQAMM